MHVQARVVVPASFRLQLTAFGGPSWFRVSQDVVTDFALSDVYPYDSISLQSTVRTRARESKLGFNAGGDVAFFLTRQLGVGFSAQ